MFARPVVSCVTFSLSVIFACAAFPALAEAAAPPPLNLRVKLDALLAEYRRLDLPFPPKDARLVRYQSSGPYIFNGKPMPARYSLAFLTKEKSGPYLRRGIKFWDIPLLTPDIKPVQPTARSAREANDSSDDNLCFALQCHSLGWVDLAVELLAPAEKESPHTLGDLRSWAWEYWEWEICKADRDWREVLRRLKALSAADESLRTPEHRDIIASLEDALRPRKAKHGKAEELIAALIANPEKKSPRTIHDELLDLGFEAVPALINHLDDQRMTRVAMPLINSIRPEAHENVKDVAFDLLRLISDEDFDGDDLKSDVEKWWKEARPLGQEKYALRHFLDKHGNIQPNQLEVLRKRYPSRLPALYRKILDDHPNTNSSHLAEAIADSPLPVDEKLKLLRAGASRNNLTHRSGALEPLLILDRPYFLEVVRKTLRELPRDVKGPYQDADESRFARFVYLADEPGLWNELRDVARRCSVGLRMELLSDLTGGDQTPSRRIRGLRLLAAFLDDTTVRDSRSDPERFKNSFAGSHYPVLSVQNFVAKEMAAGLDIDVPFVSASRVVAVFGTDVPPVPAPTEAQWQEVRKAVRRAFERENVKWVLDHERKARKR